MVNFNDCFWQLVSFNDTSHLCGNYQDEKIGPVSLITNKQCFHAALHFWEGFTPAAAVLKDAAKTPKQTKNLKSNFIEN